MASRLKPKMMFTPTLNARAVARWCVRSNAFRLISPRWYQFYEDRRGWRLSHAKALRREDDCQFFATWRLCLRFDECREARANTDTK